MLQKIFAYCLLGLIYCQHFDVTLKSSSNDIIGMFRGFLVSKYESYLTQVGGKLIPVHVGRQSPGGDIYNQLNVCNPQTCIPFMVIDKEATRNEITFWMTFLEPYPVVICGYEASGITFDEQSSSSLQLMSSIIFVDYKDARGAHILSRRDGVTVSITPYTNHLKRREHFMKLGVLFLVFASACFILAMRVRAQSSMFVIRRHAEQTLKERKAKAKISQLPIRTLEAGELLEECTICLEDIKFPGKVKVLQCGHEYHDLCITPWLVSNGTCPLCKYNVIDDCRSKVKDCSDSEELGVSTSIALPIRNIRDIIGSTESSTAERVEEPSDLAASRRLPAVSSA